ncbi:leucine-rich repeat-containing protein 71 isoform X2 [Nelusetta ayraudi]|uniref:leucine-rich repeat-containing protein 71 isoform X2 n=1 Tax=Nelusetta ayraudi TaxID=303726 RepID=UPI003F719804
MSQKKPKDKADKANLESNALRSRVLMGNISFEGQSPGGHAIDVYQCTGNVERDVPELCALLGIKDVPLFNIKRPSPPVLDEESELKRSQSYAANLWLVPFLEVEQETEDPLSTKNLKVSGWKVDKKSIRVLQKVLPSLSKLQGLKFWQAGIKNQTVMTLINTVPLCSNLRTLAIESNPLADHVYYKMISADTPLTHLSLRCNQIGDEGARLIGLALSNTTSANKNLLSLNLAFNSIGDAGAAHIAKGLRLNRTLVFLSLLNNQIGDYGATRLAETLAEFALTHDEVLERRKLLLEKSQALAAAMSSLRQDSDQSPEEQHLGASSTSLCGGKQDGKARKKEAPKKTKKPAGKENTKAGKKDVKASQGKDKGAQEAQEAGLVIVLYFMTFDFTLILIHAEQKTYFFLQDNQNPQNEAEMEKAHPLLDPLVQCRDGEVFLPGNTTLASLNLAGNKLTTNSLDPFLKSLEMQSEGGLLRLCLERNRFTTDCGIYLLIKELLGLRDPLS